MFSKGYGKGKLQPLSESGSNKGKGHSQCGQGKGKIEAAGKGNSTA